MQLQLPDFFQELKGRVISAEIGEQGTGLLHLSAEDSSGQLGAVSSFCRQVGLRLDLSSLGAIEEPAEERHAPGEYVRLVVEAIAVFAATALLSRTATVSLELREAEVKAFGLTIVLSISPFGGQSDQMLSAQLEEEFGVKLASLAEVAEEEGGVDLLGGQFTIGSVQGSLVEGPVYRAFHASAGNYVHPVISSTPVDVVVNCKAIDADCVPEDAEKAVAITFARALRLYFLGEPA